MAQLFNNPGQQSSVSPPNPLPAPPNGFQGQIYRRKPKSKFHIKLDFSDSKSMLLELKAMPLPASIGFIQESWEKTTVKMTILTVKIDVENDLAKS